MKVEFTQARDICNVVRKNFLYESPWYQCRVIHRELLSSCKDSSRMRDVVEINKKLTEQNIALENVRDLYQPLFKNPFQYFKELIASVHKYQVQNCGELARITYAVSRMNGFKNSDLGMAHIIATEKRKHNFEKFNWKSFLEILMNDNCFFEDDEYYDCSVIDHVATQIQNRKGDNFIIDVLFNECRTNKEMEKLYASKYAESLGIRENEDIEIVNLDDFCSEMPILQNKDVKKLAELFPNLVLPENQGKLDKTSSYIISLINNFKKY